MSVRTWRSDGADRPKVTVDIYLDEVSSISVSNDALDVTSYGDSERQLAYNRGMLHVSVTLASSAGQRIANAVMQVMHDEKATPAAKEEVRRALAFGKVGGDK